jgi:hypothetical protein
MGAGGGGGGGGKGGVGSGVSPEAMAMIQQAMGENIQAIHNRYQQLGLGVPAGGSAAGAASSGTSLQYGGPSTMEQQDIQGQQLEGNAAIGELQNQTAGQSSGGGGKGGGGIGGLGQLASIGLMGGGI